MRKKPVIRRWRRRFDLQADRLKLYPKLFAVRVPKALELAFDWREENLHWCPVCTGEMFERYGSYASYKQIMETWGTIWDYHEAIREKMGNTSENAEEIEWPDPFEQAYEEPPEDDDDIVLFFICTACSFITPASQYDDAVRNYSDWYDKD